MAKFRIFIPTRNSAKWIGVFLDQYRKIGVEPLYIVDARSTDDTEAVLREKGAELTVFMPSGDFAEAGMVEEGSKLCGTDWVVRLDDDEFPSHKALEWLKALPEDSKNQAFFLSRRELFARDGVIYTSCSRTKYPLSYARHYMQPQARLHHVNRVVFLNQVHTIGFKPATYTRFAPDDAFFIHLNCLMRTPEERLQKLEAYEEILPTSTLKIGDEYLPELFSAEHHRAESDHLAEFADLFANLPIDLHPQPPKMSESLVRDIHEANTAYIEMLKAAPVGQAPADADEIYNRLSVIPPAWWRQCAQFLCTIGARRYGDRLWDFDMYCRSLGQANLPTTQK